MTNNLAGLYPANQVRNGPGGYPEETKQVFIAPPGPDGYHDIFCINAKGDIVSQNNRPNHRIEGALRGDFGYDIVV